MSKIYTLEIKTAHHTYQINVDKEAGEEILQRWEEQSEAPAAFCVENDRERLVLALSHDPLFSLRLTDAEIQRDESGAMIGPALSTQEFETMLAQIPPARNNPYFETVTREHLGNKLKFECWVYDDHEAQIAYLLPVRINNGPPLDKLDLDKIREIFRRKSPMDPILRQIIPPPPVVLPDSDQREYLLDYLREGGYLQQRIPGTKNAKAAGALFKERE